MPDAFSSTTDTLTRMIPVAVSAHMLNRVARGAKRKPKKRVKVVKKMVYKRKPVKRVKRTITRKRKR